MKLKIKNCAKISHAEFELNGLTVIAGNNNTGKSTIGKVLYSLFRSLSNADKRVIEQRQESIRQSARKHIIGYKILEDVDEFDIVAELMQGKRLSEVVTSCIDKICALGKDYGVLRFTDDERISTVKNAVNRLENEINRAQALTNEQYQANIVQRIFDCVFHGQIRPLQNPKLSTELILEIQGEKNEVSFTDNGCEIKNPTKIFKTVRYISTADVLSLINNEVLRDKKSEVVKGASIFFEKYVWELACELQRNGEGLSTADQIEISESLKELNQILNQIVRGDFKRDSTSQGAPFSLFEEGQEATKAENLSMGLKFFVLLRHMLQMGILNKKDILILDEPENHLHPEWQVQYARILVLLQKTYDLTLLVTSHSPDMVSALQRIADVEHLKGVNFYLAEASKDESAMCTYRNLGKNIEPIFDLFNVAIDKIDTYQAN